MAEFNRTSLDIMDEIYAPFKEAQAQKRGLERQAGGAALSRQLQLTDAYTKRQQQLTDATTAQDRGLERITHEYDERARVAEEAARKLRDENLKDKRAEAGAVYGRLEKKGINLPFSIEDINSASTGQMSSYMRELNLEEEIDHANKKSHAEVLERLKAVDEEILREVMGLELDHLIDWDAEGQKSKSELADMLGQAVVKKNTRKFGKNVVPQYKHLLKQQIGLLEETGILDIITTNPPGSDEAAKAIAKDEIFILNLKNALTNSKLWPGDPRPKKAEEILALLERGLLKEASERLDGEGQAGNQPLIEAFTRWTEKSNNAIAVRVQDRMVRMQGGGERLRAVGQQLNGLVARHPWLEETVDILDIYTDKEYEAFQGRRRVAQDRTPQDKTPDEMYKEAERLQNAGQYKEATDLFKAAETGYAAEVQGGRRRTGTGQSLEPGDPGLEGATLFNAPPEGQPHMFVDPSGGVIPGQVGSDPDLGGLALSPADVANFVDPQATSETQAAPQVQGQALDRFDRDGDGTLDAYEKLLKADEDKGFASGAGGSIGGGTIAPDERSWAGKQLDKAGNYLFPRHMAGEQQPSFLERYDPDADYWGLLNNYAAGGAPSDIRAGAGDVVLEFGGMFIDAWLGAGGLNLLRGTPAALGRVKALVSTPSVGIGAFGRTPGVTSTIHIKEFANALGGGAALESFKAFVKNPANVREAVKWVRESGWRYSQGATPKLVPKKFRLNFTPVKPPGSPIVPAAPTP